jgi:putative hydrolase of the HAD superfamily
MKKIVFLLLMASYLMAYPKAIVFDFDGVMARQPSRETIYPFLKETLLLSKVEFEGMYEAIISGRTDAAFWRSIAKEKNVQLSIAWGNEFKALVKNSMANPEMFALVDRLKQKPIPVVLFSNMDLASAQIIREMGLFASFDQCFFADEIGVAKPDPKSYQILLKQLDLSAQDVVFIDDSPDNIQAAQELGIDAILFQSASQLQQELQKRLKP